MYDEEASKEILRVAAEEHGIELSSVKSDLYTKIGLDSKVSCAALELAIHPMLKLSSPPSFQHESKMRSSIWQPKELGFDKETMKVCHP